MLGDAYTIVDMAVWGWAGRIPFIFGQDDVMEVFPNLARLVTEIDARPAAVRACALKDQHAFKKEFDDDSMRHLYPQIFALDPD